jgi:hypothetical protein
MRRQGARYAHRIDVLADAPLVWSALTDAMHLARCCSPGAVIQPRQGGLFRASIDRVTEFQAHIGVRAAPAAAPAIYLPAPTLPRADSVMIDDFILDKVPGGTILRLLGSGVPATAEWDTQYWRLRTSWQQAMNRLKVYVEKQLKPGEPS